MAQVFYRIPLNLGLSNVSAMTRLPLELGVQNTIEVRCRSQYIILEGI